MYSGWLDSFIEKMQAGLLSSQQEKARLESEIELLGTLPPTEELLKQWETFYPEETYPYYEILNQLERAVLPNSAGEITPENETPAEIPWLWITAGAAGLLMAGYLIYR